MLCLLCNSKVPTILGLAYHALPNCGHEKMHPPRARLASGETTKARFAGMDSTDRRNTLGGLLCRGVILQGLAGPFVHGSL